MAKKRKQQRTDMPQTWTKLAVELKDFVQKVNSGDTPSAPIPDLKISIELIPGEYWNFQPGWVNLRWWWEEIKISCQLARNSLLKLQAYYLHERTLEYYCLMAANSRRSIKLDKHLAEVVRTRSALTEEVATRLFSISEKI